MQTVDYRAVLGFIKDQAGDLIDVNKDRERIKRLIHKCIVDVKSCVYLINRIVDIEVVDGIATLPCDLIRILRITDTKNNKIGWNRQSGNSAVKVNMRIGTIRVYYRGIPTMVIHSESGQEEVLAILPEQIDYAGHYAISILLREQWVRGLIPADKFQYWDTVLVPEARSKAKGMASLTSIDEMERMLWMQRNGQFIGGL